MTRKDLVEEARKTFKNMGYRKINIIETFPNGRIVARVSVPDGTEFTIDDAGLTYRMVTCPYCETERGVHPDTGQSHDEINEYCDTNCRIYHQRKMERDSQGILSRWYGAVDDWCRKNFGVGLVK